MNYGKLTAGTTKTAIDTAKPSEKGEIITYLSRMGDVLHDIEKRSKLIAVLIVAVHAVGDSDKVNIVLPEHDLSIESGLQIISTNSAHVLYQNMSHLSSFNIGDQPLPCGTLKISSAPTVIGIVDTVRVTSLLSVAFEIFFLVHNRIAVANLVIVTGQSLVQCRNFLGIKSHSLFHAHDALLSDCRLICGDSIIPQVPSLVTVSLRIIRKILSSSVSPSESLNTTLTL